MDRLTDADIEQLRNDYDNHDADPYEGWHDYSWYGVVGMLLDRLAAAEPPDIDEARLADAMDGIMADYFAASPDQAFAWWAAPLVIERYKALGVPE